MSVLSGVKVLDLSWGVAGPAAGMLLADHGAEVTRIERPGSDPYEGWLHYRVHHRGKRSAVLDLTRPADRDRFLRLASVADVVIETYSPGVAERLGIGYEDLAGQNPGLVHCSITGYGRGSRSEDRPGHDQLVAARCGFQWEVRAWPGSVEDHLAGRDLFGPDTDLPAVERRWLDRLGPVFTATPGPSISAAFLATLGISAALRVRAHTGRGQRVETSLLQGVLAYTGSFWQRGEPPPDAPRNRGDGPRAMPAIMDHGPGVTVMSGPWSLYECADGRWVNQWTSRPEWAILAARGDELTHPDPAELEALLSSTGGRAGDLDTQLRTRLAAKEAFARHPQADWVRLAAEAGVALQPVRSPEEVLCDPALEADGAVAVLEDPELGSVRQVGVLCRLSETPGRVRAPAPRRGEHTVEVCAEADALGEPVPAAPPTTAWSGGPLAGVRVVDFGLAVAGPWAGELLAQLGADVIKVDPPRQDPWLATKMAMKVNRSKRHLSLDAKAPGGREVAEDLVRSADVVLMNLRPRAAAGLGLDYESVRALNSRVVYCRTAGYDPSRAHLPGNDQTGNALGGTEWEDGGMARGGRPYWSVASGGDLGNGFLSAIGIVWALAHRDRTGVGQQVETNIVNAAMFGWSAACAGVDGTRIERPTVGPDLLGLGARYRLYECRDGWLCLAALDEPSWRALAGAVPGLAADERFASPERRAAADDDLAAELAAYFAAGTVAERFEALDSAGVPCEISSVEWSRGLLEDPEALERRWIVERDGHPVHGRMRMFGEVVGFSDTQADIGGPPPVPGQHTRDVLDELGYGPEQIEALVAAGAVRCAAIGVPAPAAGA